MNRRLFLSLLPIPFLNRPKPKLFEWNMHPAQRKFLDTIYSHEMRIINVRIPSTFGSK